MLHSVAADAYATAIFGVYDARTHTLTWSRAGHCLPVLAGASGARLLDDPAGPLLGLCTGVDHPTNTTELRPGDVLLVHTDGLYERHDRSIAIGEAVLVDLLPDVLAGGPELRRVVEWLPSLVHETDPEDDICLLALRRVDD